MHPPSSGLFNLTGRDIWFFGGAGYLGQPCVMQAVAAGARALCVDLSDRAQKFVADRKLGAGWRPGIGPYPSPPVATFESTATPSG